MRVLVTDSNSRPALAATRSLGTLGHVVVTCGDVSPSLAGASRFSSRHELSPSPSRDPDAFAAFVADLVRRHRIDVLLPMTEVTTLTLLGAPAIRQSGVATPFADAATVAKAADKALVVRLARSLGIPVPQTTEVEAAESFDPRNLSLEFPVVIKPSRSRAIAQGAWISGGVSYAHDEQTLRRGLEAIHAALYPVLLQERIEGPGIGVFVCYDGEKRIAAFAHRRIREMPPSGGVSTLCESCLPDPVAVEHADRLLGHLGWRGPAMVEFKQDRRDNSLRIMEINGRFWGSLQLAIDAGVDFPALAVAVATGEPQPEVTGYRVGVRSRWFWGDASSMLLLLTRTRRALDLPPDHPGRWRTLMQFARLGDRATRNDVLRLDDWRPFVLESRRWFRPG